MRALLALALGAAFVAGGCGKKEEKKPCPKIPSRLGGANCVYGQPGGPCADLVTPATCRDGVWRCPLGLILVQSCKAARPDAGARPAP